jgi:hypothetical protein
MKTRIAALIVGALVAAPAFVQFANAAPPSDHLDPGRERAIRECMAVQKKDPHQSWGNSELYYYRACMGDHGQPE